MCIRDRIEWVCMMKRILTTIAEALIVLSIFIGSFVIIGMYAVIMGY